MSYKGFERFGGKSTCGASAVLTRPTGTRLTVTIGSWDPLFQAMAVIEKGCIPLRIHYVKNPKELTEIDDGLSKKQRRQAADDIFENKRFLEGFTDKEEDDIFIPYNAQQDSQSIEMD